MVVEGVERAEIAVMENRLHWPGMAGLVYFHFFGNQSRRQTRIKNKQINIVDSFPSV